MSLSRHYRKLEVFRFNEDADFGVPEALQYQFSFQGLIQLPNNANTFINGKDTSAIAGVLFCSVATGKVILEGDRIKDTVSGQSFLVSGAQSQPLGISGLKPTRGQHVEFNLEHDSNG